eukprot:snap_masked-scaffold_1-processed-gene-9.31-mRNA-1 protein AED:1.00 eAED:1.00 QI:0/0/0/0/1/1/2/0/782
MKNVEQEYKTTTNDLDVTKLRKFIPSCKLWGKPDVKLTRLGRKALYYCFEAAKEAKTIVGKEKTLNFEDVKNYFFKTADDVRDITFEKENFVLLCNNYSKSNNESKRDHISFYDFASLYTVTYIEKGRSLGDKNLLGDLSCFGIHSLKDLKRILDRPREAKTELPKRKIDMIDLSAPHEKSFLKRKRNDFSAGKEIPYPWNSVNKIEFFKSPTRVQCRDIFKDWESLHIKSNILLSVSKNVSVQTKGKTSVNSFGEDATQLNPVDVLKQFGEYQDLQAALRETLGVYVKARSNSNLSEVFYPPSSDYSVTFTNLNKQESGKRGSNCIVLVGARSEYLGDFVHTAVGDISAVIANGNIKVLEFNAGMNLADPAHLKTFKNASENLGMRAGSLGRSVLLVCDADMLMEEDLFVPKILSIARESTSPVVFIVEKQADWIFDKLPKARIICISTPSEERIEKFACLDKELCASMNYKLGMIAATRNFWGNGNTPVETVNNLSLLKTEDMHICLATFSQSQKYQDSLLIDETTLRYTPGECIRNFQNFRIYINEAEVPHSRIKQVGDAYEVDLGSRSSTTEKPDLEDEKEWEFASCSKMSKAGEWILARISFQSIQHRDIKEYLWLDQPLEKDVFYEIDTNYASFFASETDIYFENLEAVGEVCSNNEISSFESSITKNREVGNVHTFSTWKKKTRQIALERIYQNILCEAKGSNLIGEQPKLESTNSLNYISYLRAIAVHHKNSSSESYLDQRRRSTRTSRRQRRTYFQSQNFPLLDTYFQELFKF